MPTQAAEKVILALDTPTWPEGRAIMQELGSELRVVKLGPVLFLREGPKIVKEILETGRGVFLDMKLHDIPNTVAGAIRAICDVGPISFLTIHATGGPQMVEAAKVALQSHKNGKNTELLAVTILTSLSKEDLPKLGWRDEPLIEHVKALAKDAIASGADGVVCSPHEVSAVRKELGASSSIICPGIRPSQDPRSDDQKRARTLEEALRDGASKVVVGRPVLQAKNPRLAWKTLLNEAERV